MVGCSRLLLRTSLFPDVWASFGGDPTPPVATVIRLVSQVSGSHVLPVKKAVRTSEQLAEGDRVEVSLQVVDR